MLFFCWIECFFFTQTAFQIQMDSNCKGWGPASPFKGFTSTGDHLSNKQTNKEKAFRFPWRRKKRLWAEKERIKWKSSVATGSIDPWPNFEQIHFVTLSVNRQHFHVARKAYFLPSFMPLLVQSHNPSCDNTNWENLLHNQAFNILPEQDRALLRERKALSHCQLD